jgi:hypothetical protein
MWLTLAEGGANSATALLPNPLLQIPSMDTRGGSAEPPPRHSNELPQVFSEFQGSWWRFMAVVQVELAAADQSIS